MDEDPVLRSLGEELARDDPRLAALLDGGRPPSRRRGTRALLAFVLLTPVVTLALVLPPTVTLGVFAMLLAVASPLAVCWLCADDRLGPRPG